MFLFPLLVHLQNSCRKIMMKQHSTKKLPVNDVASVAAEERFIKKLREQQKEHRGAEESRKTLHKCLHKLLHRNHRNTHQLLSEVLEEVCYHYLSFSFRQLELTMSSPFSRAMRMLISLQEFTIDSATPARNH